MKPFNPNGKECSEPIKSEEENKITANKFSEVKTESFDIFFKFPGICKLYCHDIN